MSALAHYPILSCTSVDSSGVLQVACEAGFSDRSKAPDVIMEVISEDDDLLVEGRTDADARFRFNRPEGVFFIIMDAGPGHVLEIASDEIEGL
ncbi:MAG: hypothetical protein AAGA11_20190 [Pseudomonadota bacterium]